VTLLPRAVRDAVLWAVSEIDRDQPVEGPWLISDFVDDLFATLRFVVLLASGLAILAAGIATAGVYSLMAFAINRSTREIVVRKALGARTTDVVWLFLRRSAAVAVPAFGIEPRCSSARFACLGSRIPGVRPEWGVGLGIGAIGFAALIVLATLLPTRRAAAVEPSIALASE
jgi:ABC-type antimicrobial peptide transport system permease subunit